MSTHPTQWKLKSLKNVQKKKWKKTLLDEVRFCTLLRKTLINFIQFVLGVILIVCDAFGSGKDTDLRRQTSLGTWI